MIFLYRILTYLIYPFLIILIFFRKIKKKEDVKRYKEKIFPFSFNVKRNLNKNLIWFHAASIGEVKSIFPIIDQLNQNNKNLEFLITTLTLSSSIVTNEKIKDFSNMQHRFLPLDIPFLIKKFINDWRPSYIFLVDSEIWPNLILASKEMRIPVAILNARITEKSFKKWMILKKTAEKVFRCFKLCLVSNLETKKYFEKLRIKNVYFAGNLKFIDQIDQSKLFNVNEDILINKKFWCAASTHEGEEEICFDTHLKLKKDYKKLITIIFPRHIERIKSLKKLCDKLNLSSQILNNNEIIDNKSEIVFVNSFGNLPNYFKFANSVFIGKSLLEKLKKQGGQNPIEAATMGCKIYHGPYVYNFHEVYNTLSEYNITKMIKNSDELAKNLKEDFKNANKDLKKNQSFMNNLSNKTLINNMRKINNFILNENK